MRKWHRWLSVFFGLLILFIAVTGLLSHIGSLVNDSRQAAAPPPAIPAGFVCPETMTCRPKPQPGGWNVGFLHHLHSGEEFGPVGTALAMLSGVALVFFAFSGLWMYLQMFRARAGKSSAPRGGRFFW
ncbi:PepSY domain-containing protein [Sphingomonas humi]|uniref:PepSY domain-containing protein n=1 Tax=Sphingomonas humi TaxID=335630 RepID=A0ABP7RH89_9SPHN